MSVAVNRRAWHTVLEVPCPLCEQGVGRTCVTVSLNEATFPHAVRLAVRRADILAEVTP